MNTSCPALRKIWMNWGRWTDGKYTSSHLDKMIDSMTTMWDESDPELRQKIKTELTELVNKMTV